MESSCEKSCGIFSCSICLKTFRDPRSLPCLHTFCEECLDTYIQSNGQDISSFACPVCGRTTTPPNSILPTSEWAASFPLNHMIGSLVDNEKTPGDGQCEQCKRKLTQSSAEYWCVDCHENICAVCQEYHRITKALMQHKIVDISLKAEHSKQDSFDKQNVICQQHQGKPVNIFCLSHLELCCTVCFATNHRDCKHILDIEEAIKVYDCKETSSKVIELLKQLTHNMSGLVEKFDCNKVNLSAQKEEITKTVEQVVEEIIHGLQQQLKSLKNETTDHYKEETELIDRNKKTVNSFIRNIEYSYKHLETLAEKGTTRQIFVTTQSLLLQLNAQYEKVKACVKSDSGVSLTIEINEGLKGWNDLVGAIGTLAVSRNTGSYTNDTIKLTDNLLNKVKEASLDIHGMSAQAPKSALTSIKTAPRLVKTVSKKEIGNVYANSGTFLQNGNLLLADSNGKILIEFDEKFDYINDFNIRQFPSCLLGKEGSDENVVYVVVNRNVVQECVLHKQPTVTRRINVPFGTWGVALTDGQFIATSRTEVLSLSQDGFVIKTIPKTGAYQESYCTISTNDRRIYHTDGDDVVCRNYDLSENFRYTHKELKTPIGLCLGENDNILVCGYDSHNIHQIAGDGSNGQILLPNLHSITRPHGILFCTESNNLVVTSSNEDTVMEVYEL